MKQTPVACIPTMTRQQFVFKTISMEIIQTIYILKHSMLCRIYLEKLQL